MEEFERVVELHYISLACCYMKIKILLALLDAYKKLSIERVITFDELEKKRKKILEMLEKIEKTVVKEDVGLPI